MRLPLDNPSTPPNRGLLRRSLSTAMAIPLVTFATAMLFAACGGDSDPSGPDNPPTPNRFHQPLRDHLR
jgi:hypothetical protein